MFLAARDNELFEAARRPSWRSVFKDARERFFETAFFLALRPRLTSAAAFFLVDSDVFVRVPPPGSDPRTLYKPADFDFQLRQGSAAVDAGVRLPGVNDGFVGRAPDLGAYELGQPVPHYGPRPFLLAVVVVVVASTVAALLPLRGAARIDPAQALRTE